MGEFPKIVESMVYRIKKYNIYPIKINLKRNIYLDILQRGRGIPKSKGRCGEQLREKQSPCEPAIMTLTEDIATSGQ